MNMPKIVLLTLPQMAITQTASEYFGAALDTPKVRPMFRQDRANMSVGLALSEDRQHYIVREVVDQSATEDEVTGACHRLMSALAESYANVTGRQPPWCV